MKNKCTVIHIDGLRGLLIFGFIIACAIAGFLIFPAWCCQHTWNYIAGYVINMPLMELKHGILLWLIIALILYATMFSKFKIACVSAKDFSRTNTTNANISDEEILNAIEMKIKENREAIKAIERNNNTIEEVPNEEKSEN